MNKYQRVFSLLSIGLLMAFLVACGASEETTNESSEKESADQKRTVQHLMGETELEGEPKNIAVLQPYFSDFLISLGIKPTAAVSSGPDNENSYTWYLKDQLEGVKNIGWQVNPNLETILSSKPDLILSGPVHEKSYESLNKIAPTILIEDAETKEGIKDWRKTFLSAARVFNKELKANEVIAEYDKNVEQAKQKINSSIGDETVMFLRIKGDELRYYSARNFDVLYGDLGLTPPPHFPSSETKKTFEPLALEKLPEVNPDHIFLLVESKETYDQMKQSSIWKNLTSVKSDQVYEVDYDLWLQGYGPIANNLIVKEATDFLTK